MPTSPTYTAIVQKKVKSLLPILDNRGKPVFLDPQGKSIPRDERGELTLKSDVQKFETIISETYDDPLTDEAGNPVEAGSEEALLRRVKEHFAEAEDTEILRVIVRECKNVKEVSGEDLAKVK